MAQSSALTRLKSLLYPMVQQNDVSDAMLTGPADALGYVDATLDLVTYDGRYVEPNVVRIESDLLTLTQLATVSRLDESGQPVLADLVDWTRRFQPGDEVIVGGSLKANNGRRRVASVAPGQLVVDSEKPFLATESGLVYGKTTFELLRLCRELLLFPGGYETDTELREQVLANWIPTMIARGSRSGIKAEMDRVSRSDDTAVLESIPPMTTLGAANYAHSSFALTTTWGDKVEIGDTLTVLNSSRDSNGRYTVYGKSGNSVVIGHRARRAFAYPTIAWSNTLDLQFREDRAEGVVWVRLVNTKGTTGAATFTLTTTGASIASGSLISGSGTVATTSTVATITLSAPAGSVSEAIIRLTSPSESTTFQLAVNSGTPDRVRLGGMSLCRVGTDGLLVLGSPYQWRWGGMVRTGLRSEADESDLMVYERARPGWYLGVSAFGSVEEDAYTMAFPDEFVVVEVDHRNPNYTERDLETLVSDVLLPADTDGVLGLI
jgi:hypothetical protein